MTVLVRRACDEDLSAIQAIYNEGIEDRIATLDTEPKTVDEMAAWWRQHGDAFPVVVASTEGPVVGWASLNRFSDRCAHAEIADISIYVGRASRGRGVGRRLLDELEGLARGRGFRKVVLHALNQNEPGKRLYRSCGFREVGVFEAHGCVDGRYVDVVLMEKVLEAHAAVDSPDVQPSARAMG